VLGINALRRAGVFALWFLAIASIANGVVHPLLAFSVSGYFPGLWTSPFIGIFGVILFGTINAATDRGKRHGTSASA
jgi:hypothetical protein